MLKKRNTESFVNEVAKELGISKKAANAVMSFGMKNVCRLIARGEEIQLNHFGNFYFDKKAFSKYLKKGRDLAAERRINNVSEQGEKTTNNGKNHND